VLNAFYRQELKQKIPGLLNKWLLILGVTLNDWWIQKMKTK